MDKWMPGVQFLIGVVTAVGLGALIVNTIVTGRDIPSGLLALLMSVIGAVFGLEAITGRKKGGRGDDS